MAGSEIPDISGSDIPDTAGRKTRRRRRRAQTFFMRFAQTQKEILTRVFFCEYCDIFKNAYFEENLGTATFE